MASSRRPTEPGYTRARRVTDAHRPTGEQGWIMISGKSEQHAAYTRLLAEVVASEAVRAAEDVLGEAWLATLSDAEAETENTQQTCMHIRDTAYDVMRSAQSDQDVGRVTASYRELPRAGGLPAGPGAKPRPARPHAAVRRRPASPLGTGRSGPCAGDCR